MPNDSHACPRVCHGTLDVVLATPHFIVAATDSRRTFNSGGAINDARKLFPVGKRKILAIAGLVSAALPGPPWLPFQAAPLLEWAIEKFDKFDEHNWNDLVPLAELPPEFAKGWAPDPAWWRVLDGPITTIYNIGATFGMKLNFDLSLEGLLAGFKANGQAKIQRMVISPQPMLSAWGRVMIGHSRQWEIATTSYQLIWKTAGATQLADQVLGGAVTPEMAALGERYSGIGAYLRRRAENTADAVSEQEAVDLANALIRATAEREPSVGREPLQLAIVRPNEDIRIEQPEFPQKELRIPRNSAHFNGVVFTPDYPHANHSKPAGMSVYTNCVVSKNQSPIPLGGNYFYGCEFENAVLSCAGGEISFGTNNKVRACKLVIAAGANENELEPIVHEFDTVERG
jgi:hypothetical protein